MVRRLLLLLSGRQIRFGGLPFPKSKVLSLPASISLVRSASSYITLLIASAIEETENGSKYAAAFSAISGKQEAWLKATGQLQV